MSDEKLVYFDIETTGLSWAYDRVTTICAKTSDGKEFSKCQEDLIHAILSFDGVIGHQIAWERLRQGAVDN